MSTIDTVTDDRVSAAAQQSADAAAARGVRATASADCSGAAAERRSLLVPVLSTAVGALIVGVLGLAVLGFNTLRDDIRALDSKMDAQIGALDRKIDSQIGLLRAEMHQGFAQVDERFARIDARFVQIDERFARIDARFVQIDERFARIDERLDGIGETLLDHTDRLARIETIHGVHGHPVQQS